ncbi:MAG: secondary thiamine-phosphate synthase enzyme YjbQ [Candidatus Bathyarchaeales archaeon]
MRIFFEDVRVSTKNRTEVIDVTADVEEVMRRSGVINGICIVHTVHSTTAIIVNEHESGLMKDIVKKVQRDFPKGVGWLHDRVDDNADAHLASSYIGPTRIFPVREGGLVKGPWQNIFLLELDGPRTRKIMVEIIGE